MDIVNAVEYKPENWNPWYFRRTYEGVGYLGTDDADYNSDEYNRWKNMIQRCYNKKIHKDKPYYKDKFVCEEWHNFANFRIWYREHMIPGEKVDLDKDLLCKESNMYSPETCVFMTHYLNTVFEDRGIKRTIKETDDGFRVRLYGNSSHRKKELKCRKVRMLSWKLSVPITEKSREKSILSQYEKLFMISMMDVANYAEGKFYFPI